MRTGPLPYLLLVLATLFWSGNFVIGRGVHAHVPPIALAFWRWTVALIVLTPFALHHAWRERALLREHWKLLGALGILGVSCFNTLVYLGLQTTGAINAVVVYSTVPVIIVFFSWAAYRDTISLRQGIGGLVSLAGVLWVTTRGEPLAIVHLHVHTGDLLVLAAAFTWAAYSVLLRHHPPGLHPLAFLLSIIAIGVLVLSPAYGWELSTGVTMHLDATTVAAVLYVAVFASLLSFICWNRAVRWVGANRAGIFVHLMPVFSTILAILFLGERLHRYHLWGIGAVASGIVLTTFHTGGAQSRARSADMP